MPEELVDPEDISPVVGEKRQREEDEHDEQESHVQVNDGNKSDAAASAASSTTARSSNGSTNGIQVATQSSSAVAVPAGGAGGANANFDALYIGDLQWVCLSSRLVPVFVVVLRLLWDVSFFIHSGRPMRICAKSLPNLG